VIVDLGNAQRPDRNRRMALRKPGHGGREVVLVRAVQAKRGHQRAAKSRPPRLERGKRKDGPVDVREEQMRDFDAVEAVIPENARAELSKRRGRQRRVGQGVTRRAPEWLVTMPIRMTTM
jgi:hypothetical protein